MDDVLHMEYDENGLFNQQDWTQDELKPSLNANMRLSVSSAFDDVNTAFAAGSIEYRDSDGHLCFAFALD